MELQVAVEVRQEQAFRRATGVCWVEPGIVGSGIEDHRLAVVDLPHRLAGRRGDDRAARDVELPVVCPKAGERERLVPGQKDEYTRRKDAISSIFNEALMGNELKDVFRRRTSKPF